jgi:hypothetical protein
MAGGAAFLASLTILLLSAVDAQDGTNEPIAALTNTSTGTGNAAVPTSFEASACVAPKPEKGFEFSHGPKGLGSLKYNGESLHFKSGGVELFNQPKFRKADGTVYNPSEKPTVHDDGHTVTQTFSWGRIQARYSGNASRLTIHLLVENSSNEELQSLELRLAMLKFPETPTGAIMDVGMWGNGGVSNLGSHPVRPVAKSPQPLRHSIVGRGYIFLCGYDR